MSLELARVLIDFGLLVLIWMVQLMIYPSFMYYSDKALVEWHKRYTLHIAIIVSPLMLTQLGIYIVQVLESQTLFTIAGCSIVIMLWVLTFTLFVPLHRQITNNQHTEYILRLLVMRNWIRTLLWSGLFVWSLIAILN